MIAPIELYYLLELLDEHGSYMGPSKALKDCTYDGRINLHRMAESLNRLYASKQN